MPARLRLANAVITADCPVFARQSRADSAFPGRAWERETYSLTTYSLICLPMPNTPPPSRRDFLKSTSTLAAAGAMAATLDITRSAHASVDDTIKVGLIGCGGRGTGAAGQALNADKGT